MGEAARGLGYEYLAICDHTRNVRVVPGLGADDVRRQGDEIAAADVRVPAIASISSGFTPRRMAAIGH